MENKSTEPGQPAKAATAARVIPDEPTASVPPRNTANTQNESAPAPAGRGDSRRFYTASLLGFFAKLPPLPGARTNHGE